MFEWEDDIFKSLVNRTEPTALDKESDKEAKTPASLKAKIYSRLLSIQNETGPLASLTATSANGRGLCVFEDAVRILPIGEQVKSLNFCRVCHARLLGEKLSKAPIYWKNCPYADFHRS